MAFRFFLADSLQKIFTDQTPKEWQPDLLRRAANERLHLQLAYTWIPEEGKAVAYDCLDLEIRSDRRHDVAYKVYQVGQVPVLLPGFSRRTDDNVLFRSPRLCPDILVPLAAGAFRAYEGQWRSLWIELLPLDQAYELTEVLTFRVLKNGEELWRQTLSLQTIEVPMLAQQLIHTQWFHADCLADYYNVEVFSEMHWRILGNFMAAASDLGVNLLLTPIFTPPLDTQIGGERTTVQLVDITKEGQMYSFAFEKLARWLRLAETKGIRYFEMAHFFSQWGAYHAPKIMVFEDGRLECHFGWDTAAEGVEYASFLEQFIPALLKFLSEQGVLERCYFHVSDEPDEAHLESYKMAVERVRPLLKGCKIIDALSSFSFYETGLVEHPIPASDHISPFLEAGIEGLWTYYCCSQSQGVSNRFMAMPSARNRILGIQLYLYNIEGFLHWGFNFYNSQFSLQPINPYLVNDAIGAFPAGDSFLVYPGAKGEAIDSIRGHVLVEALQDMRLLQTLEQKIGRDAVQSLIHEGLDYKISFTRYPHEADYLLDLHERVIKALTK